MKTATVRELRNRYSEVFKWIEAGEEVTISKRGVIIARLIPQKSAKNQRVDWRESAALRLDRTHMRRLSTTESAELLAESQEGF